jgi:hypothetical protein
MSGDQWDLSTMLSTAKRLVFALDTEEDEDGDAVRAYETSEEIRRPVAQAALALLAAFDSAEQTHRRDYNLTGTKKVKGVGTPVHSSPEPR